MSDYYHGGWPGLKVGDRLLPPDQTKAKHTLSAYAKRERPDLVYAHRRDCIYLVTDSEAALFYAAMYPNGGRVYQIEPIGLLEADPDCIESGLSWLCPSGIVLAASPLIRLKPSQLRKLIAA